MGENERSDSGADISGEDSSPDCAAEAGSARDEKSDVPLNVIDLKEIVVKVMWGAGALMMCGGLGALSIGASKPAIGLLGVGGALFAGSYAVERWT